MSSRKSNPYNVIPSITSIPPPPPAFIEARVLVALGACVIPAEAGFAEVACLTAEPRAHAVLTEVVCQKYTETCCARTEHCPQDVALVRLRLLIGKPEEGAEVIVGDVSDEDVTYDGSKSDV